MPSFNGTGPRSEGPITGRGLGYCAVRLPKLLAAPSRVLPSALASGAARRFLRFGRGPRYGAGRAVGPRRGR